MSLLLRFLSELLRYWANEVEASAERRRRPRIADLTPRQAKGYVDRIRR